MLEGAQLQVHRGEIVTLIGPNGAGKTTLVRAVLGAQTRSRAGLAQAEAAVGYMPQKLHVDPTLPLSVLRFLRWSPASTAPAPWRRWVKSVPSMSSTARCRRSPAAKCSALLARALLREPELLVLDEPVQGVDVAGQAELYRLIGVLRDRYGCGVLMVSHDLHLVMSATDQVVCLNRHVCCSGHPEQVSSDPAFVELFGQDARSLAIYHHQHDHSHDLHGSVVIGKPVHGPDCKH